MMTDQFKIVISWYSLYVFHPTLLESLDKVLCEWDCIFHDVVLYRLVVVKDLLVHRLF
jgi:hypothetical protein